jgi:hypothetical protein
MGPRRFPPPWTVRHNEDAYWVEDANGARFGFCYYRTRAVIGTGQEAWLDEEGARRIAANIARLPAGARRTAGLNRYQPNVRGFGRAAGFLGSW